MPGLQHPWKGCVLLICAVHRSDGHIREGTPERSCKGGGKSTREGEADCTEAYVGKEVDFLLVCG